MPNNRILALVMALAAVAGSFYGWRALQGRRGKEWNTGAIRANYVGAQLTETDPQNAALLLTYELTNNTDSDARLQDGPNSVVMSRLKSDHSLSAQENIRLSFPALLPAHQSARIALEVRHPLAWPADNDPQMQDKLKNFVNQRLEDVSEFVLFDQADHFQIELPGAWRELKTASAAGAAGD